MYHQFICSNHAKWANNNPQQAFLKIQEMQQIAESFLHHQQYHQAIPYLGTALETAELIFDSRLESPQLTTTLTSLSIMLANAYSQTNESATAHALLDRINNKMEGAASYGEDYQTKVAFYKHCIQAINEASLDLLETNLRLSKSSRERLH